MPVIFDKFCWPTWAVIASACLGTVVAQETVVTTSQGIPLLPLPGTKVMMAAHETRVSDWSAFIQATSYDWRFDVPFEQEVDHPVVGVNAADAEAFCAWLTRKERAEGRMTSVQLYRLPTDQEWRAATSKTADGVPAIYPWGDAWPPPSGVANLAERSPEGFKDGFEHTSPVGKLRAISTGFYDLAGNVWEWTLSANGSRAALRGGSWAYARRNTLRTDYVYEVPSALRAPTVGFRLVLGEGAAPAQVAAAKPLEDRKPEVAMIRSAIAKEDTSASSVAVESAGSTVAATPKEETTPAAAAPMNASSQNSFSSDVDALLKELAGGVGAMDQSVQENLRPAAEGQPFTNSLGMEFVPLDESSKVLICRHEVRAREYDRWLKETGRRWEGKPAFLLGGESAAAAVNYENAKQFCGWLTLNDRKSGLIPGTAIYRLPTDREWSLAAGLGREVWEQPEQRHLANEEHFPWGAGVWPPPAGTVNLDSGKIEGYEDEFPYTAPVNTGSANDLGLFNMGGNVAEWCEDRWSTRSPEYVIRGGSWLMSDRELVLTSHRGKALPRLIRPDVGLRCALDLEAHSGR